MNYVDTRINYKFGDKHKTIMYVPEMKLLLNHHAISVQSPFMHDLTDNKEREKQFTSNFGAVISVELLSVIKATLCMLIV